MYNNILVINLMHIGDLMLATPVLRTLRVNYPQARISLLADKKLAELVCFNKHIDECLFLDKKGEDNHIRNFIKFISKVRSRHFDLVINLHRNERASALAAFSGAKRIVGYSKPVFSLLFDKVMQNPSVAHHIGKGPFGLIPPYRYVPGWKHQVHAHLEVLRETLGIERMDDGGLEMWLSEEMEQRAEKIWQENFSPGQRVIAFNIGASWKTKRWLGSYFARCADALVEEGYAVAFFGGPMDLSMVRECIGEMAYRPAPTEESKVRVFTGKLSLGELGAMLRRCSLFLTTDSGPMHIGVAMNIPIVTMFGASPVPGFYPYDAKDILIRSSEACHPCGMHECPRQGEENMACMKCISVDTVMGYVRELLAKYGGKPARELPSHYGQYECTVVKLGKQKNR